MDKERNRSELEKLGIEPMTLIYDILHNWWAVLLGTLAAAMLTYVAAGLNYVPQYTASTTFIVSSKSNSNAWNNLASTNTMATMFENIIQSNVMKKIAREKLGREKLDAVIQTKVLDGTNLLVLTVTDKSPRDTIDLIRVIMENYTTVSFYSLGNATMDVLAAPQVPRYPDNPLDTGGMVKKGAAVGALAMILLFGFMSYSSDTLKREEDIEEKLDAKNMGAIPFEKKEKSLKQYFSGKKRALLVNSPLAGFAFVEAYKKLAAKVDYQMSKKSGQVLVVTSVSENEGKSTVAANLAISLAEQSKKVLLIDGDLRRPSQFLLFGVQPSEKEEFGEFLKKGQLEDILKKSRIANLYLVLGKNCYSSSTEILRSKRLSGFLKHCRNYMDYVIIDSPPAGLIGDAEMLAFYSDAVLLVSRQNDIFTEDINDVLDGFREHHSEVLGVVLNGVRSLSGRHYGYGKYGGYGAYGSYGKNRGK